MPNEPTTQALPDEPIAPQIIRDDITPADDLALPGTSVSDRHAAYHAQYAWHGQALHPYGFRRSAMFHATRRFTPLGYTEVPDEYKPERALEVAVLLFLVATPDDELKDLLHRPDLVLDRACEWMDEHVAEAEMPQAGKLAFEILKAGRINIAVPRPDGGKSRSEGNSPAR